MKSIWCSLCGKAIEQGGLFQHLLNIHSWKEVIKPESVLAKPATQTKPLPKQTHCPKCNVLFESKAAYRRHHKTCQQAGNLASVSKMAVLGKPPSARVCPYCNIAVSRRKFEAHVRSKCPKRKKSRQINKENGGFCTDPAIEKYLALHPEPPKTGKFGVPQAKFKYSTYGRSSMEYDTWSKS